MLWKQRGDMNFVRNIILLIMVAVLSTGCFLTGDAPGEISGRVLNSAGEGVSGVTVVTNPSTNSVITNSSGDYIITGVSKAQTYVVTGTKSGYTYSNTSAVILASGFLSCDKISQKNVDLTILLTNKGTGARLYDAMYASNNAADFSSQTTVDIFSSSYYDFGFWYDSSNYLIKVGCLTGEFRINNLGWRYSLDTIGSAPVSGYTEGALATIGNCYVVKTKEGNYAKFKITNIGTNPATGHYYMDFDWAYQSSFANSQFSPKINNETNEIKRDTPLKKEEINKLGGTR